MSLRVATRRVATPPLHRSLVPPRSAARCRRPAMQLAAATTPVPAASRQAANHQSVSCPSANRPSASCLTAIRLTVIRRTRRRVATHLSAHYRATHCRAATARAARNHPTRLPVATNLGMAPSAEAAPPAACRAAIARARRRPQVVTMLRCVVPPDRPAPGRARPQTARKDRLRTTGREGAPSSEAGRCAVVPALGAAEGAEETTPRPAERTEAGPTTVATRRRATTCRASSA